MAALALSCLAAHRWWSSDIVNVQVGESAAPLRVAMPVWTGYVYDGAAALVAVSLMVNRLRELRDLQRRRGSHRLLAVVDPTTSSSFYRLLSSHDLLYPRAHERTTR